MLLIRLSILSFLLQSCVSAPIACTPPVLPTKPIVLAVVAQPGSTGRFNGQNVDISNYACFSTEDIAIKEIWVHDVVSACKTPVKP